jgi:hypothetical protein
MLNLTLRAQVPQKAGAKLQHFHETNKSFAKFYITTVHFLPKALRQQTILRASLHDGLCFLN